MDLNVLLFGIGAMGFFTSRAFLPAFVTALLLRYGDAIPFISSLGIFSATGSEPSWFTSDISLWILGTLALCEVIAGKVPEAQELLDHVYRYGKTGLATLTMLGVISVQDAQFVGGHLQQASLVGLVVSGGVAIVVFGLSGVRQRLDRFLMEADPDDDLRLRMILSVFEDLWAGWGIILLLLYPLLMAGLVVLVLAILVAVERKLSRMGDKDCHPCPHCGHTVRSTALSCPSCQETLTAARKVGWFGQATSSPVTDREVAALALLERQRCPVCAKRLESGNMDQSCPDCGHMAFADPEFVAAYSNRISWRLLWVLPLAFLLSSIPILGLIPGVILYRCTVVSGYRRYLHGVRTLFIRWMLRIVFLLLILLQLVPGPGAIAVPVMALLSYAVYRRAFWKAWHRFSAGLGIAD